MNRLMGKVAAVTGGAQGLGAEFALALASAGASVVVGDLASTASTCDAIRAIGGNARGVSLDVTSSTSVEAFVGEAVSVFGRLDVLVNNAAISGIIQLSALTDVTSDEWDRVMTVNARGTFECIKAAVRPMKERGYGKIINLASGTAIKGSPGLPHYVASKGAIIALTRAAARELGEFGIRVNALAPGLTMSEGMKSNPSWSGAVVTNNIASRAIKREALPEDLLGALVFLASPDSDFVTGQTLSVDGGSVMN
jgi:NAD(P)-dependent dehydrogenase (short-subunit alcohol dehydrogenase family)